MKKRDGRAKNGGEDRGLTEDSQLIRGPSALLEAMRERARTDGQPVSEAWRRAAAAYLNTFRSQAERNEINRRA